MLACCLALPSDFSLDDFGSQIRRVRAFLHQLQATPGTSVAQAFPARFQHAAQKCMPRDVGEFVSELVTWLESEAISMTWERRYLAAGSRYPQSFHEPWIYAESMRSAFLSAGPLCTY